MYTTQSQIRAAFWSAFPEASRKIVGGDHVTDTRVLFVDYVDTLARDGTISDNLAQRVTLAVWRVMQGNECLSECDSLRTARYERAEYAVAHNAVITIKRGRTAA
jgi:hypothetical protein